MKKNYLNIVLFALVIVVLFQGYFIYDMNRTINNRDAFIKSKEALVSPRVMPFIGFFGTHGDPFREMERIHHEMEKRFMDFEDFVQTVPSLNKFYSKFYRTPSFDMKEQDGKYVITIEVPGLNKDAINIKTEHGKLIISASVSQDKENNTTSYYHRERRMNNYRHVILLPVDANEKSLHSEYKDGLLTVTFEKTVP